MALKLLVGTILGFLTGLGIGGGSLLLLWLTIGVGMEPAMARRINLLFFLPSALIACCFRWKQGLVSPKKLLPAILSGAVSAAVFSFLGLRTNPEALKKGFGVLLLITGARELLWRPNKNRQS